MNAMHAFPFIMSNKKRDFKEWTLSDKRSQSNKESWRRSSDKGKIFALCVSQSYKVFAGSL